MGRRESPERSPPHRYGVVDVLHLARAHAGRLATDHAREQGKAARLGLGRDEADGDSDAGRRANGAVGAARGRAVVAPRLFYSAAPGAAIFRADRTAINAD